MTRPTLREITQNPGQREREDRSSELYHSAHSGGATLELGAGLSGIGGITMLVVYLGLEERPPLLLAGAVAALLAAALLGVRVRQEVKRKEAAWDEYEKFQVETVNLESERRAAAVRAAETHYGVTGLEPAVVSFQVGVVRNVYVTREGETIRVQAVFPSSTSPLTLVAGDRELASR